MANGDTDVRLDLDEGVEVCAESSIDLGDDGKVKDVLDGESGKEVLKKIL